MFHVEHWRVSMLNPTSTAPLEYAKPDLWPPPRAQWVYWAVGASWLTACVGTAIIYWNVESVLFSGPLLLLRGLLISIRSLNRQDGLGIAIGSFNCFICLLLFGLVQLLRWSPQDALYPFRMDGNVVYCRDDLSHPPFPRGPQALLACGCSRSASLFVYRTQAM
jgi:hypothetical protein